MGHLDLYSMLSLDRSRTAAQLRHDIDTMRGSYSALSPRQKYEIELARSILGDSHRRSVYDIQLNNPSAPTITYDALHQLTKIQSSESSSPPSASTGVPVTDSEIPIRSTVTTDTREPQPRRQLWVAVGATALTAGTVTGLIVWGLASGNGNTASVAATETIEETVTETATETSVPTAKLQARLTEDNKWEEQSGNYGYETGADTRCNTRSQSQAVFTSKDSRATCEFAVKVGDSVGGTDVDSGTITITEYSDESNEDIDVSCQEGRDGDNFPYWNCETEYGSGIIIYP